MTDLTRKQQSLVRAYVLSMYVDRGAANPRIAADGGVTIHVDRCPNADHESGRIFAGWDTDLLREATR